MDLSLSNFVRVISILRIASDLRPAVSPGTPSLSLAPSARSNRDPEGRGEGGQGEDANITT